MFRKSFYIKLAVLIVPVVIFFCIPFVEGNSGGVGGGGNYDLSGLFYGFLILATIITWIIFILIHSIYYRHNQQNASDNKILLTVGIVSFIISYLIYHITFF